MASEAAIAAVIASAIWSLKYGKCQFCGDSTTPSSETSSDAITFLIGSSSESMSRPTFGRLSIPVTHSFALANFQELRNGEVVRRIHLLRGWVNTAGCADIDLCRPCTCERLSALSDDGYARIMLRGSTTL